MTITLTFETWMIPFGITIFSCIIAWVIARFFKNYLWGILSTGSIFFAFGVSVSSWVIWGLMVFIK